MSRFPHPLARASLLLALAMALPSPAPAQSDPAAQSLIDQLRPRAGSGTRGIRLPAAEPAPAAVPQAPSRPALPAAAAIPAAPAPARHTATPAAAPRSVAATTAPAGAAAVSITVNFPSGSATLTPQAEQALAPLGRALSSAELAAYHFRIEGHTDTVGDAEANRHLSERRADAVRDLLVRKYGVAPDRLEVIGLGESQPLVPTADETPEQRNRRVQVVNLNG